MNFLQQMREQLVVRHSPQARDRRRPNRRRGIRQRENTEPIADERLLKLAEQRGRSAADIRRRIERRGKKDIHGVVGRRDATKPVLGGVCFRAAIAQRTLHEKANEVVVENEALRGISRGRRQNVPSCCRLRMPSSTIRISAALQLPQCGILPHDRDDLRRLNRNCPGV